MPRLGDFRYLLKISLSPHGETCLLILAIPGAGEVGCCCSPCTPRREGDVVDDIVTGPGCPGKSVICFCRKVTGQTFCSEGLEIFPCFDCLRLGLLQLTQLQKYSSIVCHGSAFCVVIKIYSI